MYDKPEQMTAEQRVEDGFSDQLQALKNEAEQNLIAARINLENAWKRKMLVEELLKRYSLNRLSLSPEPNARYVPLASTKSKTR